MRHLGKTNPFRDPRGQYIPSSIAEVNYLPIGGVDQWVMIRGESLANPALVLLSGGPGLSETSLFRHFLAPLERHFTLVYWDQRGAGKSFDRHIPRSSMTVAQFQSDLDQVVDYVRGRLSQQEVVLFGHSWGAALGVLYAAKFPQKVAAYVGSGQIGDWAKGEVRSYAYALAEAERQSDAKSLAQLRTIGPPPYDARRLWTQRTCLQKLAGTFRPANLVAMGRVMLEGPEVSVFDMPNLYRGFRWSLDVMWDEVSKIDLLKAAPELQMPVFFFLGRQDHWVPPECSMEYFDVLKAPSKKVVWFESSGHEPFADEPAKFNAAMLENVRSISSFASASA